MNAKITGEHLRRKAYVYVRQFSMDQVRNNRESRRPAPARTVPIFSATSAAFHLCTSTNRAVSKGWKNLHPIFGECSETLCRMVRLTEKLTIGS